MASSGWKCVSASTTADRTHNPIRAIVDNIKMPKHSDKELIPLSLGDPTVFGNFKTPEFFINELIANLGSYKHNGYVHSAGTVAARKAIAQRYSVPGAELTENDVVVGSGCSGAIELAISVLANEGDNLLLPQPGFSLYETLAKSKGINVKYYKLQPDKQWEVDVASLEALIDEKTRAIVVNNPSNPCGSVYSQEHLKEILAVAERHKVPIIADEIYGNIVFAGSKFHPMASLTTTVPILSTGGIAKEFLVPGWRVGWVLIHDKHGAFAKVREGLFKMSQLILGANSLVQSAIPKLLAPEAGTSEHTELKTFEHDLVSQLSDNASFVCERLQKVPGLRVIVPQGAMYVMVGIKADGLDVADDLDFTQKLLDEEAVFVLPGQCFGMKNFFRVVFSPPKEKLATACDRIEAFCQRHAK